MGTVLWFKPQKGYGFIKPDDGGADVFIHVAELAPSGLVEVKEGDRLTFRRDTHGDGRFFAVEIGIVTPSD
jgi:cold shock CspA family protein